MTADFIKKISLAETGLKYKLLIIEALIFALPFFILVYALSDIYHISRPEFFLICLPILLLILSGLLLLRQIFDRIVMLARLMTKDPDGVMTNLSVARETAELKNIVTSFTNLQKKLDDTAAELHKRVHDMRAIREMGEMEGNTLDAGVQVQALLNKSMVVTGASAGVIFYMQGVGEGLRLIASQGTDAEPPEIEEAMSAIVALIAADRRPLSIRDVSRDSRAFGFRAIVHDITALCGMPILVRNDVEGVLLLALRDHGAVFHESDTQVLATMIDRFRRARENALLLATNEDQLVQLRKKSKTLTDEINRCKQTEESLRRSEDRYRTIIENIEDSYYEIDLTGNAIFYNKPSSALLGYTREELLGMNFRRLMDEENAAAALRAFNEVYRTGKPSKGIELEIIRKDGVRRYVEVSASIIKNPDGKPVGFRGIGRDITERKK